MGCGFSTSRENAKSADQERILEQSNKSDHLSAMGSTHSKNKNSRSPSKKKSIQGNIASNGEK